MENVIKEEGWVKVGHFIQLGIQPEVFRGDLLDEQVLPED